MLLRLILPTFILLSFLGNSTIAQEEVFKLDLTNHTITDIQELEYKNHKNLSTLILRNNYLDTVPNFVFGYGLLVDLQIIENPIQAIPSDVVKLKSLRSLTLHDTRLKEFPEEFFNLYYLTRLDFQNNNTSTEEPFYLSPHFKFLPKLKEFTFNAVYFDTLLVDLGNMPSLEIARFSNCRIKEVVPFSENTTLWALNLDDNQLMEFPESVISLTGLKILSLKNNRITEVPEKIYRLKKLDRLDLRGNLISEENKAIIKAHLPYTTVLF